jgi:hypothetical protein
MNYLYRGGRGLPLKIYKKLKQKKMQEPLYKKGIIPKTNWVINDIQYRVNEYWYFIYTNDLSVYGWTDESWITEQLKKSKWKYFLR